MILTINEKLVLTAVVSGTFGLMVGIGLKWAVETVWKILKTFVFGDKS